ncbi:MFS transporter [Actinokineospora sp.]|uniref:MFS transporter n=1 Tax=Actinokineospora sp. TaxID=1872133 RepID=UPI00403812E7
MTITEVPGRALWSAENRATTLGVLLLITIGAFEHLGVSTAMPSMLADLDGGALYSWPFTAFLAASVVATVLGGRVCDRVGPGPVLMVGPALFLAGLVVAGTAQAMPTLLAARALQGVGLGAEVVAIYVLVAVVYPERSRPAAFGLLAAAWVVPSIVGPTAAGLVTERFGWRWVFLGLVPLAVLGVVLLVPALRRLPPPSPDTSAPARRGLPLAAVAAGVGISAVSWAAQHPSVSTLWLGLGGLAALVPALRTLLPTGTLRGRAGLPRVVLARGLLAGAFFGVEAFVPLTLTAVHGFSPAMAGLPLTVGALGWSLASVWQGRHPEIPRTTLIRWGFGTLATGLAAMAFVGLAWGPPWLAAVLWVVCGAGMGMSFPSLSVLALGYSAERDRGFTSSALQVADMMFSATMVGLGGVLLTALASAAAPSAAVVPIDLVMAGVAAIGVVLFRRTREAPS